MKKTLLRAAVVFVVLLAAVAAFAAISEPIRTENGLLSGIAGAFPEVRVFQGIPFAAPPVGDLRWRPPQPAKHWDSVRAADKFSANCMQRQAGGGAFPPYGGDRSASEMSEDCLYLNVYTTAASANDKRPVMVWIHGGAYTSGAGAIYQGEDLARKGVVVVTVNYRLGVFGFLAHPELTKESANHSSGDYAFLDQIAALQWVQKNIAAFGGDPTRVTIFGESAGSWAVNVLMASPLAKGLFQRAIGESGGSFSPMKPLAEAEREGEKLAASMAPASAAAGKTSPQSILKTLRAKPAEGLLKSSETETARAIVDGWVLPEEVAAIFAQGKQNDVPLLVGYNADEGTTLAPQGANLKALMFVGGVYQRYGLQADAFLQIYPAASDEQAVSSYYSAFRDQLFGWEMRTWARMATKTGHQPAYLYYFSRRPPGPQSARLRAFHASEIPYVFGTFVWPFPWEEADKKLSDAMASYWVNFAATGNPNGGSLVKWPAYSAKDDQALEFGGQIAVRSEVNKVGLDFFDGYYQSLAEKRSGAAATAK